MYKKIQKSLRYGSLLGVIVLLSAQPSLSEDPLDGCYAGIYPNPKGSKSPDPNNRICMKFKAQDFSQCESQIKSRGFGKEHKDHEIFQDQYKCLDWSSKCPTCDAKGNPVK